MAKIGAMIKPCPDCGKDVSTDAQACPHCGKPVPKPVQTTAKVVFGIIGGILLAIALMLLFGRQVDAETIDLANGPQLSRFCHPVIKNDSNAIL